MATLLDWLIELIEFLHPVISPACGDKIKITIRQENVQHTLHTKRKRQWYIILGKSDIIISKETKKKKKKEKKQKREHIVVR